MNTNLEKKYINACMNGDINQVMYMIKSENKLLKNVRLMADYFKYACKGGHYEIFNMLHEYKSVAMCATHFFYNILQYSCEGGNIDIINKLLNVHDNEIAVVDRNNNLVMTQCLISASIGGKLEIFKMFAADIKCLKPRTVLYCLYCACGSGNLNLAALIVNICTQMKTLVIDWDECLTNACESGNMEIVELCITNGATNWNYGLQGACLSGNIEIVKYIASKGATNFDNNCMRGAGICGNVEIVNYLMKNGATNYDQCIAGACEKGKKVHMEIIELMINKGITNWYHTIICAHNQFSDSVHKDCMEIIKFLVLKGKDKGLDKFDGCFICACECGDLDFAKIMIDTGNIKAGKLYEGFEAACYKGHNILAHFLISKLTSNVPCSYLNSELIHVINRMQLLETGSYMAHFLINMGATNLQCLKYTTDFQLYLIYCKHIGKKPLKVKYGQLLKKFPPYILLVGSQTMRKRKTVNTNDTKDTIDRVINSSKKLPIDIFRLLFMY